MPHKKLVVRVLHEPFPQPTTDDLEQEALHTIHINDFWRRILVVHLNSLAQSHLWENFSEEIENSIAAMIEEMSAT